MRCSDNSTGRDRYTRGRDKTESQGEKSDGAWGSSGHGGRGKSKGKPERCEEDRNARPDAVDDTVTILGPGGVATGNLLSNDTDGDNDPLRVIQINGVGAQVGAPVDFPEGRIFVQSDGSYSVEATSDFSFTYTIRDGRKNDSATVNVKVIQPVYFEVRLDGQIDLWRTDGTPEGTTLFLDASALGQQQIRETIRFEDGFIFQGFDPVVAGEPWFTDGTVEGTFLLADLNVTRSTWPSDFTVFGDKVVFTGRGLDSNGDRSDIFVTDGTAQGTFPVANIWGDPFPPAPAGSFLAVGDRAYFGASSPDEGRELWRTDGTPDGTVLVADLLPGPFSSRAEPLFEIDGSFFVRANRDDEGFELWISDGEDRAGMIQLADDTTGTGKGPDGDAFFFRLDKDDTYDLWRSDGTVDGTELVADLNTNGTGGVFTPLGDIFVFVTNYRDSGGFELWKTDGTADGTDLIEAINATGDDSSIFAFRTFQSFSPVEGGLIFVADDGINGLEPWFTDGTPDGTQLVLDINPAGDSVSQDEPFAYLDGRALFSAKTPDAGNELWISDGTPEGTSMLADINSGPGSSFPDNLFV